jgi:hypothetical protein
VTAEDYDRLDEAQLDELRRELARMSDAALATAYEFYRTACGLRADGIPRPATMQRFLQVWKSVANDRSGPRHTDSATKKRTTWSALCLHFAYYNFCRIHRSIRDTLAVQAGITDRV